MKLQNFNLFPLWFTADATADTEFTVTHGCTIDDVPIAPKGLIITRRGGAAQLYYDPATWTSTGAKMKCDTGGIEFNVLFVV